MKFDIDGTVRDVALDAVVIAGYTGRDRDAVQHHIDELAAIGVPPPASVPAYWLLPGWLASQEDVVVVTGTGSSGEAEVCLVIDGDETFVSLASDHTDRNAEATDIGLSKAICPKPVAGSAWPVASVEGRWDELVLRSWITIDGEEVLYQEGTCDSLVPPPELRAGYPGTPPKRFVMLTGTMPVIGEIRPAAHFRAELSDPATGRSITLDYDIRALDAEVG
jgi:hypothetical protein